MYNRYILLYNMFILVDIGYIPICCGELDLALSGEWTNDIPESGDRHSKSRTPDTNDFLLQSDENTSPNSSAKLNTEPPYCRC